MIDLDAIRTLADIPRAQAAARGTQVAIRFGERTTTYADLAARSEAVARALLAAGVAPGDRVAVLARNDDRWFPLFFGTALARACLMPVNCRLAAPEVAFIVADGAPKVLVVGPDLVDTARAAIADLDTPPLLVVLEGEADGFVAFDAWSHAAGDAALPTPESDDDVLQLYTSGTTGRPKGVVLTNRTYRRFLEMSGGVEGFAYAAGDMVMVAMPLFHVAGTNTAFAALAHGGTIELVRDFVPADAIALMQERAIAHAFLAPAMILMMLNAPAMTGATFPALRTISYGASPIAEDVLRRAQAAFGCDFVQFYGMTESAGAGTSLSPSLHARADLLTSCGRPWPDVKVRIVCPQGTTLPAGTIGQIAIRGDIVMKGYWNRPEATAEAVQDGWLLTGDAGYMDADGHVFVHDRVKDMIVTGGENVYPAEVENAIQGCPGVADVAVIGVPDDRWGEAVMALVVPAADRPDGADVIAWARRSIAGFKAPRHVAFVDTLPRNASGKVLRRELRAPYWEGRERQVG